MTRTERGPARRDLGRFTERRDEREHVEERELLAVRPNVDVEVRERRDLVPNPKRNRAEHDTEERGADDPRYGLALAIGAPDEPQKARRGQQDDEQLQRNHGLCIVPRWDGPRPRKPMKKAVLIDAARGAPTPSR